MFSSAIWQSRSSASEEGLSQSQSSDYEDQEDIESVQQPKSTHSVSYKMWSLYATRR